MSDQLSNVALRFLGTRHDASDLSAVDTRILSTGACVYVESANAIFALRKESTETADGVNIVAPVNSPGRWFRLTLSSLVNNDSSVPGATVQEALNNLLGSGTVSTVTDWYVGGPLGNNDNDGLTAATPFADYEPLNDRIGSLQTVIAQDTTIYVLGDIPDSALPFTFYGMIVTPFILRLRQENPTELGTFTLGAVQNIVVNATFPTIQLNPPVDFTTAGPGGTSLEGVRFRKVSGPGAADVGTIFWLEEVTPGDPTVCYVSRPQFANPPPAFSSNESLATDDVYVAEALGVMGKHIIFPRDNQVINFATTTVSASVENGRGVQVESQDKTSIGGCTEGTAGVCYHGCHLNYGRMYCDFTNIQACRFGRVAGSSAIYTRRLIYLTGTSVQAPLTVGGNGSFQTYNNPSFCRGGRLGHEPASGATDWLFWDSPGFREWTSLAALRLGNSQGRMRAIPWGTSTVAGTYGINIGARGRWTYVQAPTVSGAAAFDYDIGGIQDTYAGGPLPVINPANGAMLVVDT